MRTLHCWSLSRYDAPMNTPRWMLTLLLLPALAGCANKKKEDAPPPAPPTVPHSGIHGPWGAVDDGLSLHANLPRTTYAAGEPVQVRLAVGNFGAMSRAFPAALSEPRIDVRGDLLTLYVDASEPPTAHLEPGQAYPTTLAGIRLAPGSYRLRITIDGAERSADQTPAWEGRLVSTDLAVTVAPRRVRRADHPENWSARRTLLATCHLQCVGAVLSAFRKPSHPLIGVTIR